MIPIAHYSRGSEPNRDKEGGQRCHASGLFLSGGVAGPVMVPPALTVSTEVRPRSDHRCPGDNLLVVPKVEGCEPWGGGHEPPRRERGRRREPAAEKATSPGGDGGESPQRRGASSPSGGRAPSARPGSRLEAEV